MLEFASNPGEQKKFRAPLLWILVPQLLGYIAALHWELSPWLCAVCGTVLALQSLRSSHGQDIDRWKWATCLCGAVWLLSWAWYQERDPLIRDRELLHLPPRAVALDISVKRIFNQQDEHGRLSGIARVGNAPEVLDHVVGTDLYFKAYVDEAMEPFVRGDKLRILGIVQPVSFGKVAPSGFEDYLVRAMILYETTRAKVVSRLKPANPFLQFCHSSNLKLQQVLRNGKAAGKDRRSEVLVAMMLGEKASLTPGQKVDFRHSGTMHLFAISGLHVGIVAVVISSLLGLVPLPRWTKVAIGLATVLLYVQITGGQPSAMRAFLMVCFLWTAGIVRRRNSPFSALVASAVLVLLIAPSQLRNLGFQFSYAVVSVILLYGLPLAQHLQTLTTARQNWIPSGSAHGWHRILAGAMRWFRMVLSVSFAATLASTPLTIAHFGIATPGTVFLNLFLVTLAALAIKFGTGLILAGVTGIGFLAICFHGLAVSLTGFMLWIVGAAVQIPGFFREMHMHHPRLGATGILILLATLLACHTYRERLGWHFFWIPPAIFATYLTLTAGTA